MKLMPQSALALAFVATPSEATSLLSRWLFALAHSAELRVSRTCHEMIVDHAGRLHQRVADRCADKLESTPHQIAAHRIRFRRPGGYLSHRPPTILLRFAADKTPKITVEASQFFPNREKCLRILDRRRDFQPIPDDAGVPKQPLHIARAIARYLFCAKSVERLTIVLPFLENRGPTQPRLRAFEDEKLEERTIVV
jgi:hypothetical protein